MVEIWSVRYLSVLQMDLQQPILPVISSAGELNLFCICFQSKRTPFINKLRHNLANNKTDFQEIWKYAHSRYINLLWYVTSTQSSSKVCCIHFSTNCTNNVLIERHVWLMPHAKNNFFPMPKQCVLITQTFYWFDSFRVIQKPVCIGADGCRPR